MSYLAYDQWDATAAIGSIWFEAEGWELERRLWKRERK
jgi:hypothetical protein